MNEQKSALEQRHAKELADLQLRMDIAQEMPVEPVRVHAFTVPWVVYKVQGLRAAMAMLAQFNCVPIYCTKDAYLHIEPLEVKKDSAVVEGGPYAFVLNVSGAPHRYTRPVLSFCYRTSSGRLIWVKIDIEGPDHIGSYAAMGPDIEEVRNAGPKSRVVRRTFKHNSLLYGLSDKQIQWGMGAGPAPDQFHLDYLFSADQENEGPWLSNTHAIDQLINLADAMEPVDA